MTPSQRLAAIAKVLDKYAPYRINRYDEFRVGQQWMPPEIELCDFRKLKQLAKPAKRKGKR